MKIIGSKKENQKTRKYVFPYLVISLLYYFLISLFHCSLFAELHEEPLIKIPTFLGNWRRNFYGFSSVPKKLDIIWKKHIGGAESGYGKGKRKWYGTGWTGQPLIVEENGKEYLIIGTFNHHLYKLDARTGEEIWKYRFDDIIKATPTIFFNPDADNKENEIVILCGSRRGVGKPLNTESVESFRAVSYFTGRKLWGIKIPKTESNSRDVDASALVYKGTIYIPAENGYLYILDLNGDLIKQVKLYTSDDVKKHRNNVIAEASPALYNGILYIASGSGHIYGIDTNSHEIVWDFYCGADMESTPVINNYGCMFVGIEKEYIKGNGGVFKIDLNNPIGEQVVWFFPTENKKFAGWLGGVVGSVAISSYPEPIVAFTAIDGHVYIVSQDEFEKDLVLGPNKKNKYKTPKLLWKENIGSSISTPVFIDNHLIVAGYDKKLHIFDIEMTDEEEICVTESDSFSTTGSFESTPVVSDMKIYIGSRNGWFYCLGENGDRK
ncbi:MAG: PQQ-binding-like beta-propeller repeat protein [Elusimicrobia bacterium]|nr:PQQ-binding-like beta-propeller repeat protein [Elusimicrobiota bacterium]